MSIDLIPEHVLCSEGLDMFLVLNHMDYWLSYPKTVLCLYVTVLMFFSKMHRLIGYVLIRRFVRLPSFSKIYLSQFHVAKVLKPKNVVLGLENPFPNSFALEG